MKNEYVYHHGQEKPYEERSQQAVHLYIRAGYLTGDFRKLRPRCAFNSNDRSWYILFATARVHSLQLFGNGEERSQTIQLPYIYQETISTFYVSYSPRTHKVFSATRAPIHLHPMCFRKLLIYTYGSVPLDTCTKWLPWNDNFQSCDIRSPTFYT